jgi:hypothetical protein
MKKTIIAIVGIVMLALVAMPAAHAGSQDTINFGYKSDEITPQARAKLESLSLDIKHLSSVVVTSYVPDAGDVALNQEFATKRVMAVKSFLVSQGVSDSVISTQTVPGSIAKSRMVELSYGTGAVPSAPMSAPTSAASPPPPPPMSDLPEAPTPMSDLPEAPPPPMDDMSAAPPPPPPAEEPVITAGPKTYESGVTEEDVASGQTNKTPSRWEY